MFKKTISAAAIGLVATALLLVGSAFVTGCKQDTSVYRIGAILPMTGSLADIGEEERRGIDLAVEEINAAGGVKGHKFEPVYGDSKGDVTEAVTVANRFADVDQVKVMLTAITRVAMGVAPVAQKNKTVLFAEVGHPAVTDQGDYIFRVFPSATQYMKMLIDYALAKGYKKAAVLAINDDYGEIVTALVDKQYQAQGATVVLKEMHDLKQTDFRAQLLKIKRSGADVIYLPTYSSVYPVLLKQMGEQGIYLPIMGDIPAANPQAKQADPKVLERIVFPIAKVSIAADAPNTKKFVETFTAKYGKAPGFQAAFVYDVVYILKKVMETAKYAPEKIRDELVKVKDFPGVTGNITILPNGDALTDMVLVTYKAGQIVPVE